jgi:type IV pilus assembly protein PilV
MNGSCASSVRSCRRPAIGKPSAEGFTLIEVLIALIILSIGLLGLGLLQANSLKASFSADQRTQASNLAYQMVDMMRANRTSAYEYTYVTGQQGTQDPTICSTYIAPTAPSASPPPPSAAPDTVINQDSFGWLCQVVRILPNPTVAVVLASGSAQVEIKWDDRGPTGAATQSDFVVQSEL